MSLPAVRLSCPDLSPVLARLRAAAAPSGWTQRRLSTLFPYPICPHNASDRQAANNDESKSGRAAQRVA
jgi:hypothetical protein